MKSGLDETLAALADPVRRGAVDLLRQGPHRAGELAESLGVSAPVMSRHLRTLRRGGLVEEQREEEDARVRLYRLKRKRFVALQAWLDQVESFWNDSLRSFKQHAEKSKPRRRR